MLARLLLLTFCLTPAFGQTQRPPYFERFESALVPALPAGWRTSTNRAAGGDFVTTTSAVYADSVAVLSSNATVEQSLTTPLLDFSGLIADSLIFYERRSGTHNAGLLVEVSLDGGEAYVSMAGDTLRNPGTTAYVRRAVKLPAALNGQPGACLRFRVSGDGTGTTGTIRFDNILVSGRAQLDAGLERVIFSPSVPNAGDSVAVTATARNAGVQPLESITASFYADREGNGIFDAAELFGVAVFADTLLPNADALLAARLGGLAPGVVRLLVILASPGDAMPLNDSLRPLLNVGMPRNAVAINEVMYGPLAGEPEWFELNNTTTGECSLREWRVSNRNSATRYRITGLDIRLGPSGYAVITRDTALLRAAHPGIDAVVVASPALPTFLFNNAGDAVVVFDSIGAVVDSIHYLPSWGGQEGRSLERREPGGSSADPANWGTSEDSSGSTPGGQNSLTPLDSNLQLRHLSLDVRPGGGFDLVTRVRNAGRTPSAAFRVAFSRDADSGGSGEELIAELAVAEALAPGDSIGLSAPWNAAPPGRQRIIGRLAYPPDMRNADNITIDTVEVPYPASSLVINEIMYDPLAGDAEYVELFNRSKDIIGAQGWQLTDTRENRNHRLRGFVLPPGEYLVVAADTAIYRRFASLDSNHTIVPSSSATLNNSGDDVLLLDPTGRAIDSVHYVPEWHNALVDDPSGRSLERLSAELPSTDGRNWGTSADPRGGTPGMRNSLQVPPGSIGAGVAGIPNPFSPDGDGFEDRTVIAYSLPGAAALIRLRIFDSLGRPVRVLADGEPSGPHGNIVWDGMTDRRLKAPIGIYIVLLEALDSRGGELERLKGVIVVAGRL
jgi:hypothetical protein